MVVEIEEIAAFTYERRFHIGMIYSFKSLTLVLWSLNFYVRDDAGRET